MMNTKRYNLILCEGETDQVLIGLYLEALGGWKFKKTDKPLYKENEIVWYSGKNQSVLGIWRVEGNDFSRVMAKISEREKYDAGLDSLVVITDHDDEKAENERVVETFKGFIDCFPETKGSIDRLSANLNFWTEVSYQSSFDENKARMCYLLVPMQEVGALETFMLNALSENNPEQKEVIDQVKRFIKDFESEVYLKSRRDKVKAELGISLSIFNPERIFRIMDELLSQANWAEFDASDKQFSILKEI